VHGHCDPTSASFAISARKFRRIAPNRRLACAAPCYLRRYGVPTHPTICAIITVSSSGENDEDVSLWRFEPRTQPSTDSDSGGAAAFILNDGESGPPLGVSGEGVIVRSEWDVRDDIRAGRLTVLFEDWEAPSGDVVAVRQTPGRTPRPRSNDFSNA